jgi:hypothetical protein
MKKNKKNFLNKLEENTDIRLPLDLLLILDVEELENALICNYAVESDGEITFYSSNSDAETFVDELEDNYKVYRIDEIEHDRIQAIIDLLNKAENDTILGHILDRVVR